MTNDFFITNLPNFLEVQFSSFCWFLTNGLKNELSEFPSVFESHCDLQVRFYTNEFLFKKKKIRQV